jgi:hypothetical protein
MNGTRYILDMVHHNPGEPPFQSAFLDPAHLADYGFNGQVFKHINCVATFDRLGLNLFLAGSPERAWLDRLTAQVEREIAAAKDKGLSVFYHVDLFVLPKRLVEAFKGEICDPETGRVLLNRPKTLELHRVLFDELCERFPQVDGYIIRVGETYLFDTPYHQGNGPIPRIGPVWTPTYLYDETLGKAPYEPRWSSIQADAYVTLLRFLRDELCVKHGKTLMFRTWDIFPDKLHARLDHYLDVTDRVEPHPKLLFSIKHTALDFWRRVKFNECLTRGKHGQLIEVQCQREYEGKGAYPNYVMDGVINGFEENAVKVGLKDLIGHPLIRGVYGWSRGGGWYGPYIKDELWPDLNAYVLAQFVRDPTRSEEAIFRSYAADRLGLAADDSERFRQLCLLSARAILKGRCCEAFDRALGESVLPTAAWMRDDRLGGERQLAKVFDYLAAHDWFAEALSEKEEAVQLWTQLTDLARNIQWSAGERGEFARVSAEYGLRLFTLVYHGWRVLVAKRLDDRLEMQAAIGDYDAAWKEYRTLGADPLCSSLYEGRYFGLPNAPAEPGLDEAVEQCR